MFSVRYRPERRGRIGSIGATQGKLRSDSIVSLRSEQEMTASPLQTRPSKVGTPPNHDKLTDPVLEMRARASVAWGGWRPSWTEVPTFMPERASHAARRGIIIKAVFTWNSSRHRGLGSVFGGRFGQFDIS